MQHVNDSFLHVCVDDLLLVVRAKLIHFISQGGMINTHKMVYKGKIDDSDQEYKSSQALVRHALLA